MSTPTRVTEHGAMTTFVKSVKIAGATGKTAGAPPSRAASVVLEDGTTLRGLSFGHEASAAGEVVFCTGMVGYPETLTDPSYEGQIVVATYPLVGNYGVPGRRAEGGLERAFESDRVHVAGLVVADYSTTYSHWSAERSLGDWLREQKVPAVTGVDTRALTVRLRERGSMLGKIVFEGDPVDFVDPNIENLGPRVSVPEPRVFNEGGDRTVALIDCGAKHNIVHSLASRGLRVRRVPWDHDPRDEAFDGLMISNGPGNPRFFQRTIETIRAVMGEGRPVFGICLGHQLLALAAGASTFKLKYGHRGQNQPVVRVGSDACALTSQNHGFAVDTGTLPGEWSPWYENLNDGTNEGIIHREAPFRSVQFHPESNPGPTDTAFLFDEFAAMLREREAVR